MVKDTSKERSNGKQGIGLEQMLAACGLQERSLIEAVVGLVALGENCEGLTNAMEIEQTLIEGAMRVVRPLLQGQLQRALSAADQQQKGRELCRHCRKARVRSIGCRSRSWNTLAGRVTLGRKGFECPACKTCEYPSQRVLGLGSEAQTPRLQETLTLLATTVPHEMALKLASELFANTVSEAALQDMVERRARGVQRLLQEEVAEHPALNFKGLPTRLPPAPSQPSRRVYVEIDGVLPMTREELEEDELTPEQRVAKALARQAKARGGKGRRYRLVGREVKVAVIYEEEAVAQESESRGCLLRKHYVAHLGDPAEFGRLLWAKLISTGFVHADEIVVISDGAEWIRNLIGQLPLPGRVQLILDLFHAKHRVWEVANALYGEHQPKAAEWAREQLIRLDEGKASAVLECLRFLRSRGKTRELIAALATYLENNLDRMNYPHYRDQGMRVGSGAVESANYHVIGARLKTQGCRWSEAGAAEMSVLRVDLFNGAWKARSRALLAA